MTAEYLPMPVAPPNRLTIPLQEDKMSEAAQGRTVTMMPHRYHEVCCSVTLHVRDGPIQAVGTAPCARPVGLSYEH